ncbi:MAG TPA: MFS transporter [Thermomicrobiales bacterium]|nr:MFS transporter [Thermomicrobiales bacterium]
MQRRELILAVYLPTALLAVGQGVLLTTLPFLAESLGVGLTAISLIASAAAIGTLVTDVPAGALLHKIGLRRSMTIGATMVIIGTLSLVLPLNPVAVTSLRVLAGIGTALWELSRHSFITQAVPPAERGRAISTFGGLNRIGMFGGPALGGLIATVFGVHISFLITGIMAILALASAMIFMSPAHLQQMHYAGSARNRWTMVGDTLRNNAGDMAAASIAQLFAQMIRQGRQLLIPLYGATELGLNPAHVGLVMTISSMVDMSMFFPAGIIMDRYGRKFASVPSFAIMAVGIGIVPFASSFFELILVGILIGLGNGLGSGAMMTLGADLAPPKATGEFLGIWRLIGDVGSVVGPLTVGVVGEWLGLHGSSIFLMFAGLCSSVILLKLVKETRQIKQPEPVSVS